MPKQGDQISNSRTGQHMRFLETARETAGHLLRIETVNPPHSPAEPEHVHPFQESACEVLAGRLRFRIAGTEQEVAAGETVRIPASVPHLFWNASDEEALAIQEFRPALTIADFFALYFRLARDGKLNEKGMPHLLQLAVAMEAYDRDIRVTSPPRALQVAVMTLLAPLGRILGYRTE